ncbi:MAG: PKD domain-containing protein, partial [Cyclobacteriaceae bacterium]|nr:PKD domain-containing protein [Cyclobacteriaceae bacterium]
GSYGDYPITLTVSEPQGNCSDDQQIVLRVVPVIPVIDFDATQLEGCRPLTIRFSNHSFSADDGSYKWEFISSTGEIIGTSEEINPVFTFYDPGIFSVRLTGANALGFEAEKVKENYITVHDLPEALFAVRPHRVFLPGGQLYTQNLSKHATKFVWDFGDGNTSELIDPVHEYTATGTYDITLTAINELGCADSLIRQGFVEVVEGGNTRIPNAFTPSSTGPTGGRIGSGDINDVFLPLTEGVVEFKMQIFDRWGNLLFQSLSKDTGWDGYDHKGDQLPAGVYVYKLYLRFSNGERMEKIGDITLIR